MKFLISTLFLIPGIINFVPLIGAFSNQQLSRLYRTGVLTTDLSLLLRHRAFLFGIIGAFIIAAAFQPNIRLHAAIAGLVSMVSFIVLVFALETSNPNLIKVAWIDVFTIIPLLVGYLLHVRDQIY